MIFFDWGSGREREVRIECHYPTQAKERLEWGTHRLLPVKGRTTRRVTQRLLHKWQG
jgi:hypothetical protein